MEQIARRVGIIGFGLAGVGLVVLHLLPAPMLHATTGALIPYHPWNFLSEFVRTQYGPLMTACFFLLALGTFAAAITLRHLRRESALMVVAGLALVMLGCFPTDLADLTTDAVTCGQPTRIEPCTMVGRIHNPLSTLVFGPIVLVALCFCVRSYREPQWRCIAGLAIASGILAVCGIVGATIYLHTIGWHGRWWTGLMQRSLVFPALLWVFNLIIAMKSKQPLPESPNPSSIS